MTNLTMCRSSTSPSDDGLGCNELSALPEEVAGLRKFLFSRALMLAQDRSAAEDLVQNTLVKALVARVTFKPGTNLKAWLTVILRRRFIDDHRHARVERRMTGDPGDEREEGACESEPDPRHLLGSDDVLRCLAQLSARDREVFELFHVRHLPYREIAAQLKVPSGTVGTRLLRAKRRLRSLLEHTIDQRPSTWS